MNSSNFTTDDLGTSLRFCFRSRDKDARTIFLIVYSIFFGACISLCAVLEFFTNPSVKKIFSLSPLVYVWLILFLLVLLFIGLSVWIEIFWRLTGKEIVDIKENSILIRHQILSYSITRTFRAEDISCIFISQHKESTSILELVGALKDRRFSDFNYGKVAFNVGRTYFGIINTARFGAILTPEQAKQVVRAIYDKFPKYKCVAKNAG